jgi:hypothetical protein
MLLVMLNPCIGMMFGWLMWVIGGAIVGILGSAAVSAAVIVYHSKKIPCRKISVLGMPFAGKTQMLANIRNIPYNEYNKSEVDPYDAFTAHLGNRTVKIMAGKDIGGGEEFCPLYVKLMEESDCIFFVFNGYKYLHEKIYKDDVQARLSFIYRHLNKQEFVTFVTFKDSFPDKKDAQEALQNILKSISEKKYQTLLENNVYLLDMRQKDDLLKILNDNLFK